ncbi:MAG: Ig-like domain-containing protein, partial [Micrococcales bacterium]|nr:Ig-like domain-containing protein [Micrococcales bacterium]
MAGAIPALAAGPAVSPDSGPATGGTTVSIPAACPTDPEVAEIAAGDKNGVVVASSGVAYTWGSGMALGRGGTVSNSATPVKVLSVPAGVAFTQVAVGNSFMVGLTSDGQVYAWGTNTSGQMGDGTTSASVPTPVQPELPAGTDVVQVTAGQQFAAALASDGTVYSWGEGTYGQLGFTPSTSPRQSLVPMPARAIGSGKKIVQISAGGTHVLALTQDGLVYRWGNDINGQGGDGVTSGGAVQVGPVSTLASSGLTFTQVAAGSEDSFALASNGTVYAWGRNQFGQLGDGTTTDSATAQPVTGLPAGTDIVQVAAGSNFTLALTSNGTIYGWGRNNYGQLGDGTTTDSSVPVLVTGLPAGKDIVQVAAGSLISAALASDGTIYTWGTASSSSQLGIAPRTLQSVTFGGVAATSASVTGGVITATSPAHVAGAVDVQAVLAAGAARTGVSSQPVEFGWGGSCTLTATSGFTYRAAPVVSDESAAVAEGGSVVFPPASSSGSIAGVVVVQPPARGSAVANEDGSVTYRPGAAPVGVYPFQVTYTDGLGQSTTVTYTVTVVASPAEVAVVPAAGSVQFGAVTSLGTITQVKVSDPPAAGSVVVNGDGSVSYVSGGAAPGVYSFEVTYVNAKGQQATVVYAVTVEGQSEAAAEQQAEQGTGGAGTGTGGTGTGTGTGGTGSGGAGSGTGGAGTGTGAGGTGTGGTGAGTGSTGSGGTGTGGTGTGGNGAGNAGAGNAGAGAGVVVSEPGGPAQDLGSGGAGVVPASVPQEGVVSFGVPAPGEVFTDVVVSSGPAAGTVVVNPDGSVSYVPGDAAVGTYSFDVTRTDESGRVTTVTYTVAVEPGP